MPTMRGRPLHPAAADEGREADQEDRKKERDVDLGDA